MRLFSRRHYRLAVGRLGDTAGRKTTFLITLLMMGTATAAIGALPGYATLGDRWC